MMRVFTLSHPLIYTGDQSIAGEIFSITSFYIRKTKSLSCSHNKAQARTQIRASART